MKATNVKSKTESFTPEQDKLMLELGIQRRCVTVNEQATQDHLKCILKSIIHKYNVWLELKSKKLI